MWVEWILNAYLLCSPPSSGIRTAHCIGYANNCFQDELIKDNWWSFITEASPQLPAHLDSAFLGSFYSKTKVATQFFAVWKKSSLLCFLAHCQYTEKKKKRYNLGTSMLNFLLNYNYLPEIYSLGLPCALRSKKEGNPFSLCLLLLWFDPLPAGMRRPHFQYSTYTLSFPSAWWEGVRLSEVGKLVYIYFATVTRDVICLLPSASMCDDPPR